MAQYNAQYNIDDNGTLRIYSVTGRIVAEISDVKPKQADEIIDEVLHDLGYIKVEVMDNGKN